MDEASSTPRDKGRRAILIAGPTASGKSALAIRLAQKRGGVVINADSMQVYRDLRIITARPTEAEEQAVPHRLFGHVDAAENYSVARWLADVGVAIREAEAEGRLPILVGGTGLYFRAVTEGLSDIPPVPDAVRAELRAWAEGQSAEAIHARLERLDPETASRLRPTDPQRNLRALEVFIATGKPLSAFHDSRSGAVLESAACVSVFLEPDRDILRQRIDARFDMMIETGAITEVEALMQRGLDPALPAMRAHGVPGLIQAFRGEITTDEAIAKGKADTRHYAKRQHTWFRHQAPAFEWVRVEDAEAWVMRLAVL
jgi:tRNA dimethylallyltransferase